jgi:hypothetical protein
MMNDIELDAVGLSEALSQWRRIKNEGDLLSPEDINYLFQSVFPTAEEIADTPTEKPTEIRTEKPTEIPTEIPTEMHNEKPTELPTEIPTEMPTEKPSDVDIEAPLTTDTFILFIEKFLAQVNENPSFRLKKLDVVLKDFALGFKKS